MCIIINKRFNPYSPGFSIYFYAHCDHAYFLEKLQSLFTWIFYLFLKAPKEDKPADQRFNPYSPGFSIYLN